MTCREIADFLIDYDSHALSSEQRRLFDEHLAECPECVEYIRGYRLAVAAGRLAWTDPNAVDPELPEELVQAILAARAATPATGHSN